MKTNRGLFITLEGCEGSGKSTQSKLLQSWFEQQGIPSVITREPGGTETAEKIRNILLDKNIHLETGSQLLLHFASRIEHYKNFIKPNLEKGTHVICDRFLDSTIAYQHYGHDLPLGLIHTIHKELINGITPDITFVLNIEIERHKERLSKRNSENDRYESMDEEFHKRVIDGFKEIAKNNKDRCHIIDSSQDIDSTHEKIQNQIEKYLARL